MIQVLGSAIWFNYFWSLRLNILRDFNKMWCFSFLKLKTKLHQSNELNSVLVIMIAKQAYVLLMYIPPYGYFLTQDFIFIHENWSWKNQLACQWIWENRKVQTILWRKTEKKREGVRKAALQKKKRNKVNEDSQVALGKHAHRCNYTLN